MVAVIVTPVLVVLIVQVAAFPKKLHQYKIVNEVMFSSSLFLSNASLNKSSHKAVKRVLPRKVGFDKNKG